MDYIHQSNRIVSLDGEGRTIAEVTFPQIEDSTVNVDHTFVDGSLRGRGVAGQLMLELADELRSQKKQAVLTCSYAVRWFEKHRDEYSDILAKP